MSEDKALEWDDTIQNEGDEFTLLPAGEYKFIVTNFERGRFQGSEKMSACHKAILTLEIDGGQHGIIKTTENLFLHSKAEWKVCQFFTSIGQRKKGEPLKMNWGAVIGASGKCKIIVDEFESNREKGKMLKTNRVEKFLEPVEAQPAGFTKGLF